MKNAVIWNVTPFFICLRSVLRLLVTANVVPRSPTLVALMMDGICYSESPVVKTATGRNIPEDDILHSHRCEKPQILHSTNRLDIVMET
jgi:hypothetical protein